jgi:GNAT superfamily N-acetyltransferase
LAFSRHAQQRLRAKGLAQYLPAAHEEFTDEMRQRVAQGTLRSVWSGGQPVGYFNWDSHPPAMWDTVSDRPAAWYLAGMVVAPTARGRRVGPRILRWCLDDARRSHAAVVRLDCHADNAWLRGFYESHGFRARGIVETYPGYYVCLFEQPVPARGG